MTRVEALFGQLSPEQLACCERQLRVSLPTSYQEFLLATNGGQPLPNLLVVPECGETLVHVLYGVPNEDEPLGLVHEQEQVRDFEQLPDGWICIGNDPGGNSFLLCTVGEWRGQIYYWDSAYFFESSSDEDGNTYFVADDIWKFLDSMRPMPT